MTSRPAPNDERTPVREGRGCAGGGGAAASVTSMLTSPATAGCPKVGRAPMLITAELPEEVFAWADSLRRAHYPPERNRLGAHVTLFHALPPSADDAVRSIMTRMSQRPPPQARIAGVMDLGRGTALAVDCPELEALHAEMAEGLHGLTQPKDARPLRLHITVQNRVNPGAARALQRELARDLEPLRFRFHGLGLSLWHGDLWRLAHVYPFRGHA